MILNKHTSILTKNIMRDSIFFQVEKGMVVFNYKRLGAVMYFYLTT